MSNKVAILFAVCFSFCVGSLSADSYCVSCNSLRDPHCAVSPANIMPLKCDAPSSSCYVRVVDGVTYRGCTTELDEAVQRSCLGDNTGLRCMICENFNDIKGCNKDVFPITRLTCHSCSENGLLGNCFTGFEANPTPCRTYDENDTCYIRKTAKSIERGCLSDNNKCANRNHCWLCSITGHGCNNLNGQNTSIPVAPSS